MTAIDEVKRAAEAATPGPWTGFMDKGLPLAIMPAMRPGDVCEFSKPPSEDDFRFMLLANPTFVLSLISRLETAGAERDEAKRYDVRAMQPNDVAVALPGGEHDRLKQIVQRAAAAIADRDRLSGQVKSLTEALERLADAVGSMKVPQTVAEAALQVTVTVGPALLHARETLAALSSTEAANG